MDSNGYAYIANFGISKKEGDKLSSEDICGTLGYMAPEVLQQGNTLTFTVDYFSVGVLLHELLFGEEPHQGRTLEEVKEFFVSKELRVSNKYAQEISKECVMFMNKLFERNYTQRLGYHGGVAEIQKHVWFNGLDWLSVVSKSLESPFVPSFINDNFNLTLNKERYIKQLYQIETNKNKKETSELYKNFEFINNNNNDKSLDDISHKAKTKVRKLSLKKQPSSKLSPSSSNEFPLIYVNDKKEVSNQNGTKEIYHRNDISFPLIQKEITSSVQPKTNSSALSNNKFFNYNVEDHLHDETNEMISPFKYSSEQIQINRNRSSLNKHKTVRMNESDASDIRNIINNDKAIRLKKRISNGNIRRNSFFDFTMNID